MKEFPALNQNLIQDKMDDSRLIISRPVTISKALSEMQTIFWKYGGKHVPAQDHIKELFTTFQDDLIAAKDAEIAQLKAQIDRASEVYADLVMGTTETIQKQQDEIKELIEVNADLESHSSRMETVHAATVEMLRMGNDHLLAEIKRLRDGVQKVVSYIQHDIESGQLNQQGYLVAKSAQDHLLELVPPAPVTEGKFPSLLESDVLPPNHFMGMGDDGKPFIGEISTGNSKPVTETIETESPCRLYLRVRSTIQGYCRTCDTDFNQE